MKYLIVILFFISIAYAQEILLSGKVINSEGNQPLYLANVKVENTSYGTFTNEEGEFTLEGSFNQQDVVIFSYVGFEQKQITVNEFISGEEVIKLDRKVISSQTVLVEGSIGKKGLTPATFSKIEREEISDSYITQDIPEYISYLPSTTFYSENGNGIGYNYLSIRGFDQRRISVSINGIPQNEPEDHNIYWLDFPDLLESTELIQVQRGAGSGVIGYPAVGGSINIITSGFSDRRFFRLGTSFGSYNTRKYSASFSSGLIENKYSIYAKLSQTLSSGYRQNSWVNFKSFHVSAIRYDQNVTTQINIYGGPITDGLAYNGVPKFAIKDRQLRLENLSYWEADGNSYSYKAVRRPDEKENFSQPHFELLNEIDLSKNIKLNSALFLILGNGYFDYDGSWADTNYFRLTSANGFYPTQNPTNVLIRAMVENKQWGWIPRVSFEHDNGTLIVGGELRFHNSVHWGSLNYGEHLPDGISKDYRYYYYKGGKDIFNFYLHEQYTLGEKINILGEVQLAYHKYKLKNERYLNNEFEYDDLFVNPRVGVNYKLTPELNIYLAAARVSREPRLKNYYDAAESGGGAVPQFEQNSDGTYNFNEPLVSPEKMNSFEFGSAFNTDKFSGSLNFFYMLFDDEIVKQGQVDRFGQPITGNIDQTTHAGIEAALTLIPFDGFEISANTTFSRNYISKGETFVEYTFSKSSGVDEKKIGVIDLKDNAISGFPQWIANGIVKYTSGGFTSQLFLKYVGEFYSDNYDDNISKYSAAFPGFLDYSENKVDSYFTANFITSYQFQLLPYFSQLKIYTQVSNIFDNLYAAYAIGKEFFPAAERNFIFGVEVEL